ncbi:MAG: DUF2400 domain-containing protein [Treponema sp.]|nr:DUF2400 domain-containing protein [Treponema sp.]MEE3435403.1 DUF2400 domain-containing protein [Treponema sp.]
MLDNNLAALLRSLADKYETASFMDGDPSQFLRRYSQPRDQELAAFVVSTLSFGQREQFIAKLDAMFAAADDWARGNDGKPKTRATEIVRVTKTEGAAKSACKPKTGGASFADWLATGGYKKFFPKSQKKFYRFFSYADMADLCGRLARIVEEYGSLGAAVRARYGLEKPCGVGGPSLPQELRLVSALISLFPGVKCVSQNPKGACKKLHMFLRWMVRRGSPVDLGLWDWANAADLLIPLDTHVLQESARLGLIAPNAAASAKTAIDLTQKMAAAFPGDPARADYALFGLGVDDSAI